MPGFRFRTIDADGRRARGEAQAASAAALVRDLESQRLTVLDVRERRVAAPDMARVSRRAVADAVRALALLVWNLAQAFDPDVIVMGGGMMKAGAPFFSLLDTELKKYFCAAELDPLYTLAVSKLGDNAGILGAAKLAWDWLDGTDRE